MKQSTVTSVSNKESKKEEKEKIHYKKMDLTTLTKRAENGFFSKGDVQAQMELASCYAQDKDVKQNSLKAFEWYHKAGAQDHAEAQCRVGVYVLSRCEETLLFEPFALHQVPRQYKLFNMQTCSQAYWQRSYRR